MKPTTKKEDPRGAVRATVVHLLLILPLALTSAVALAQLASSRLEREVTFKIDAQPLDAALLEFSRQSDVQVMFVGGETGDQKSQPVNGRVKASEALGALLQGTGFSYTSIEEGTVTVKRPKSAEAVGGKERSLALAQAEVPSSSKAEGTGEDQKVPSASSAAEKQKIEEVIVTAQKREEKLKDVPISIVAMGAEELESRRVLTVDDLQVAVPGLSIQSSGLQRIIQIRGISNSAGSVTSTIGMYLDEADITSHGQFQLNASTYDLQRIEVLRGPQGTLYGGSAMGGTMRLITNDPQLDSFGFDADVAASFTEGGAQSQRINAVFNAPVVEDTFGLRIAGSLDQQGGWIDQPAANKRNFNGSDLADVRIKALWKVSERLTATALAEIHHDPRSTAIGEDDNGDFTQTFGQTTQPKILDEFEIYNLTLNYDLGSARLTSSTSHVNQRERVENFGYELPFATPAFQVLFFPGETNSNRFFTQELRLASSRSGSWHWTAGGYYRQLKFNQDLSYFFGLPGALPANSFTSNANLLSRSWALFGDSSYEISSRLTFGAGIRYFRDRQTSETISSGLASNGQAATFQAWSPRLYAQFKLTDQVNLYASAAKGFRSGGLNALNQPSYGPEAVWTYEVGEKAALAGGAITIDAAIFYSEYQGYHVLGILPPPTQPLAITRNGGDAWIKGVEANLAWRVFPELTLSLNGNYLDTEFYKVRVLNGDVVEGDPISSVPKYSATASAKYDFSIGGKSVFARLDYNEQGRQLVRQRSLGPLFFGQSGIINMLNASVGLDVRDGFSVSLFAQNLLDDRDYVDGFTFEKYAARSRPRTISVQLGASF